MIRRRAGLWLAAALFVALLTAGVLLAVRALSGAAPIGLHGYLAMAAAVVGTALLAGALMALMFHSARSGWDDVDREP